MTPDLDAPKVAPIIERLIRSIVVTAKAVALYPAASHIPLDAAEDTAAILKEALEERHEVRFVVTKEGLYCDDIPIQSQQVAFENFAIELYNRRLADVRFHAGTQAKDLVAFLTLLKYSPDEIEATGGLEAHLWEAGVSTITVTDAHLSIVEGARGEGSAAPVASRAYERSEIDEILANAYGGRSRDQLTIVRFLGDHQAVATYLTESYTALSAAPDLFSVQEKFAELAEIAHQAGGDGNRGALMQALGDALQALDPELRRNLLAEEVLPQARTNEALAAVVRHMDIDSVCDAIVAEVEDDPASREGLARAIRNLSFISMAERGEVLSAAGAAMQGAGFGNGFVTDVLEQAAPSRLAISGPEAAPSAQEQPAEAIFKLMDMAPTSLARTDADTEPGLEGLQAEARRGVNDGDVIMTLVSLVAIDPSEAHFASTMSMLEDSLDLLIERGDIELAADAADALILAAENPVLTDPQQTRLRKALGRLTKPADIRRVAHALRLYAPDTPENKAARRLLDTLGAAAIEPLLDQLADEQDMAIRKSLVDFLCSKASDNLQELGAHVSDRRWFVVRNVVSILGSTHSSATLPFLERTIRHSEARVRRETIRTLSNINDRMAHQMLIAALSDEDEQNVQLAARYLGKAGVKVAVPSLEQVARGDGRGNRSNTARVEAIEALGRMGAVEALPMLEALAGRRAFMGSGKAREVKAAAEAAARSLKVRTGGVS